jgi:hypothetical protein
LDDGGPEPMYDKVNSGYKIFHSKEKYHFVRGGEIPELVLAYETWGELNERKDNVILLFTGLSPSSHAKSHQVMILNILSLHVTFFCDSHLGWEFKFGINNRQTKKPD